MRKRPRYVLAGLVAIGALPALSFGRPPVVTPFGVDVAFDDNGYGYGIRSGGPGLQGLADVIVAQQCPNGGWNWPWGGCDATYNNITGPIGSGLLAGYASATDHLDAAIAGGDYDLTSQYDIDHPRFGTYTSMFMYELTLASGDSTYSDFAEVEFFDALYNGTYSPNDWDTGEFIAAVQAARAGTWVNLLPWEFSTLAPMAAILGNAGQQDLFRDAILDGLDTLDNTAPSTVYSDIIGIAGAVRGLALNGTGAFAAINAPNHGLIDGIDNLSDLADLLAALQNVDGSWYWHSNLAAPDLTDEDTQTTAYAIMALRAAQEAGYGSYIDEIAAGRAWLWDLQDIDGSIPDYPGGAPNIEVNGEALSACAYPVLNLTKEIYYGTIQAAIDAADPGDVIGVPAGTYEEQLEITIPLTIRGAGAGSTTVLSPTDLTAYFTTGPNNNYPIVYIHDTTGVVIEDMTIDGAGRGNANYRYQGIGFWNADGDVSDCLITGVRDTPFSGAQHGVSIYAYNNTGGPYEINVTDTDIVDYQKNAFALSGDGLTANVTRCSTIGAGPTTVTAQNGIQISYGAGGSITDCYVEGTIWDLNNDWAASGILLYGCTTVDVTETTVVNADACIYVIDTDSTITDTMVFNDDPAAQDGVWVYNTTDLEHGGSAPRPPLPFGDDGRPGGDKTAQVVTITGGAYVGGDNPDTVGIAGYAGGSDSVTVTISGAIVRDWDYGVGAFAGVGPITVTATNNTIVSNVSYGYYADTSNVQDAENNWWGDPSGPYDGSGSDEASSTTCYDPSTMSNTDGLGDEVSDRAVDYCPWSVSNADLTLASASDWCDVGDTVTVTIDMANAGDYVVGGQFFLTYDTSVLSFFSADPGSAPFTQEVYEMVNTGAGTIDYAVGVPGGGPGTMTDTTMAVLTFQTLTEVCEAADLVAFRTHSPPTQLTNELAEAIAVSMADLAAQTVDVTPPEITCPSDITVSADAGLCTADLDVGTATATDTCDPDPEILGVRSDALPLTDPYPTGTTTITWTATDDCGNVDTCYQYVTVNAVNDVAVDVQLSPTLDGSVNRCITFEFFDGPTHLATVKEVLAFDASGLASSVIEAPCGVYDCVTARDELHTLRSKAPSLTISGTQYVASFVGNPGSGGHWLVGGNLNDDRYIDILDFGGFVGQYGVDYGTPDTDCDTPPIHADISGNGLVGTGDFTFIQVNFLAQREASCDGSYGPTGDGDGPITRISVEELKARGMADLIVADLNHDGWLDMEDVTAYLNGALDPCDPDINGDGQLNSADFMLFLNLFAAGDPESDFNGDGAITSQDFISFLDAFIAGC